MTPSWQKKNVAGSRRISSAAGAAAARYRGIYLFIIYLFVKIHLSCKLLLNPPAIKSCQVESCHFDTPSQSYFACWRDDRKNDLMEEKKWTRSQKFITNPTRYLYVFRGATRCKLAKFPDNNLLAAGEPPVDRKDCWGSNRLSAGDWEERCKKGELNMWGVLLCVVLDFSLFIDRTRLLHLSPGYSIKWDLSVFDGR